MIVSFEGLLFLGGCLEKLSEQNEVASWKNTSKFACLTTERILLNQENSYDKSLYFKRPGVRKKF
jgi:hypothetical protein